MKKVTYLISILFAVALLSVSCEKEDPIVPEPEQTLEQLYPDWANLTWVSTDGVTAEMNPDVYPRLNITIIGNLVDVRHDYFQENDGAVGKYSTIVINGNIITIDDEIDNPDGFNDPTITGTFSKENNEITFITKGISITEHTYKYRIN